MKPIPYSEVSKLVKKIDDLNEIISYLSESSAVILQRKPAKFSSIEQGMRISGTDAEVALAAMLREFTFRRDNLVEQINGRSINTSA